RVPAGPADTGRLLALLRGGSRKSNAVAHKIGTADNPDRLRKAIQTRARAGRFARRSASLSSAAARSARSQPHTGTTGCSPRWRSESLVHLVFQTSGSNNVHGRK